METKKFGIGDQIGYVYGDIVDSFVSLYVNVLFLTFRTYVLGIKATWAGALFLFAGLQNASNDPMIGSLPDRWQTEKNGDKFKPYTRIAVIPLAVSGLLCLTNVSNSGSVVKHVQVAVIYIFYDISHTGASMPYGSMASTITNDPIERTKLSRARSIGGTIVGIGGFPLVPQLISNKVGDVIPSGSMKVAIVFNALSLPSYVPLLRLTTECVRQPRMEGRRLNYGKALGNMVKDRPMLGIMLATVGSPLYTTGNNQLGSFPYKEYRHIPQILTLVSLISMPIILVFFPITPELSQKSGKRNVTLFCPNYNLVISTILFLAPVPNAYLFLVLNALTVSGWTVFIILIWAFVMDCIDYSEYQTGERSDGSMHLIYTLSRKIGSMLISTVASFPLGAIGYIPGIEAQTETVAHSIRYLCTSILVVTRILELIGIGAVYDPTKERTDEMYAELNRRRDAKSRT